jgi:predicted enzyme related to lactoylglutathione lyase
MASKKRSKASKKKAKGSARKAAPKRAAAAKRAAPKRTAAKKAAPKVLHPIVHWEIQSTSPERLHSFYSNVLGWVIDANNPMNYGMVASGGEEAINGGIGGTQQGSSRVVVYAAVPDINEMLARIESHGGKTVTPREDVGPVIMALYTDPEGNLMGLVES